MRVIAWPSLWEVRASLSDWRGPIWRQHQLPRGPALAYGTTWELI